MRVTLNIINDIYSKPDKTGNQRLIKRNVVSRKQFESTMITAEEFVTMRGNISNKWCTIKSGEEYFKLKHKFDEIVALTSHITVKGFK